MNNMENRIIKFRAWDIEFKMMYHNVTVGNKLAVIEFNEDEEEMTYWTVEPSRGFHFMQYIWQNDRDGKEIFVGDIIEWEYEYDSDYDGDMPIVKTSKGRAAIKDIFDTYEIKKAQQEGKGCKVIGNIFQDPELLTPREQVNK